MDLQLAHAPVRARTVFSALGSAARWAGPLVVVAALSAVMAGAVVTNLDYDGSGSNLVVGEPVGHSYPYLVPDASRPGR